MKEPTMNGCQTIVRVRRAGRELVTVYRFGESIRVSPENPTETSFDRLELYVEPETDQERHSDDSDKHRIVIDTIPTDASVAGDRRHSKIRVDVDEDGNVTAVDLVCNIRCYIARRIRPYFQFALHLKPRGNVTRWLRITWFWFTHTTHVRLAPDEAPPEYGIDEFIQHIEKQPVHFHNNWSPVLLEELGLDPSFGENKTYITFTKAPLPAVESTTNTWVIRLERKKMFLPSLVREERVVRRRWRPFRGFRQIVTVKAKHRIELGPLSLDLFREEIEESELDEPRHRVTQTQLLYEDGELRVADKRHGRWAVNIEAIPSESMIRYWNDSIVGAHHSSLEGVLDGRPVTSIPRLQIDPGRNNGGAPMVWRLVVEVLDTQSFNKNVSNARLDSKDFNLESPPPRQQLLPRSSHPATPQGHSPTQHVTLRSVMPLGKPRLASLPVVAEFRGLRRHDSSSTRFPYALVGPISDAIRQADTEESDSEDAKSSFFANYSVETFHRGIVFLMQPTEGSAEAVGTSRHLRIGSLDVRLADPETVDLPNDEAFHSIIQVDFRLASTGIDPYVPEVDLDVVLPVDSILPGGQDDVPGELPHLSSEGPQKREDECDRSLACIQRRFVRERSIIIPSTREKEDASYGLRIREHTDRYRSQQMVMNLYQGGVGVEQEFDEDNNDYVVVLDRHPFSIARVATRFFRGVPGPEGTREIGNWSSTALGGAAWELADSQGYFCVQLPPQAVGEDLVFTKKFSHDLKDFANFAFSPPSQFELLSSENDQNFVEPPWNLRRILGYPGQRAPGARLQRMQFELLYGMTCDVTYPFLRLAELTARLGAIPGPVPERMFRWVAQDGTKFHPEFFRAFAVGHSKDFRAYLSRLGVLEPWDDHQPDVLTLSEGLTYTLRSGDVAPIKDKFRGGAGLAGGALWGVDPTMRSTLDQQPQSSSALLSAPYFSALGGWGKQKAGFANNRVIIRSDTSMGRVSFYSVEQIGRIGVTWNRAKYVEVYERSVVPSKKFAGSQNAHLGRPVVRLVRSYVEILEPVRKFPDFGAPAETRGCVTGVEFKSKIINVWPYWRVPVVVNDADGNDWEIGFKIPLSDPEDRNNPPAPQIVLRCASADESGTPTIACEVDNPEKLYFFALSTAKLPEFVNSNEHRYKKGTEDATDDTNQWPPISDIDYAKGATFEEPETVGNSPDDDLDADLPPSKENHVAYPEFNFKLRRANRMSNLTADRVSGKSVNAILDNVSLMRTRIAAATNARNLYADTTLRLLRAYGDAPQVSGMRFNREKIAYYFDPLKKAVLTDPMAALVARAKQEATKSLKPLGMRLPTRELTGDVQPDDSLKDFDFSKIMPNFAGLDFSNLVPELKMPEQAKDRIKITHGFDPQTQRGWIQADINIPILGPSVLFSTTAVTVILRDATFLAKARIESGPDGSPQHKVDGRISANWEMNVGGMDVLKFLDTPLLFDESGKTKFKISPEKIVLNSLLRMLSDLVASYGDPDSGFTLKLLTENDLPIGVEAVLELPLPPIAAGTFSISNLQFGVTFQLVAFPEFAVGIRLYLSKKTSPFAIIIFILGGGGWVDVRTRYLPLSKRITTDVTVGLSAGAMLGFAFGPFNGSVYIFLSVSAEMHTDTGEGKDTLTIAITLLIGGEVNVLSIIWAQIQMLLEVAYNKDTGQLTGRGTLSVKIKVCMFLTVRASASVEYVFAGGDRRAVTERLSSLLDHADDGEDPFVEAARTYLTMLA